MKRGRRYQDIVAKYAGRCIKCTRPVEPGELILWDSVERKVYCVDCADEISKGGLIGMTPQPVTSATTDEKQ